MLTGALSCQVIDLVCLINTVFSGSNTFDIMKYVQDRVAPANEC